MILTDNLVNLFRIDAQFRGLRSRLESAERYLAAQTRQVEELKQQREELEARHRQIQAHIGNLESESAALDERLEKLRNELNAATTNKQYTAVLHELNGAKDNHIQLEDRTLQEMERVEENAGQREILAAEIAERERVRELAGEELKQRQEEVGDRLTALEADRNVAASAIPGTELKIFTELADAYEGEAMASIEEVDRRHREYACGACNMHVPFQSVACLLGTADTLVRCTACGRILFLEDETRGALAKK